MITNQELDVKIGPKTKIVAAAHVSNVLGIENPRAALLNIGEEDTKIPVRPGGSRAAERAAFQLRGQR